MKMPAKQRGMTGISSLLVGLLVAFVALSAFKLYPAYYDDFAVSTAMKNMEEESDTIAEMSTKDIRSTLEKRLMVSGVSLEKDDITIKKEKSKVVVDVNYEVRTSMYGNIDAVTKFSHSITVSK